MAIVWAIGVLREDRYDDSLEKLRLALLARADKLNDHPDVHFFKKL